MSRTYDLVEFVLASKIPSDFRKFDEYTTELLKICYARYVSKFLAQAKHDNSLQQITIDDFVEQGHFFTMVNMMTFEDNL